MITLARRELLAASGALVVGIAFGGTASAQSAPFRPNGYIVVPKDGPVIFILPRQEMGQGIDTALVQIIAEGLDIEPASVRVQFESSGLAQNTDGSSSITQLYEPLLAAGEQARRALIAAAAVRWNLPPSDLRTERGRVVHPESGRQLPYSALASDAGAHLKAPEPVGREGAARGIIGASVPRLAAANIARGRQVYAADVSWPGMLTAVIARARTLKGRLASHDAAAARRVAGVTDVIELPAYSASTSSTNAGIAVIARSTWAALEGRRALAARFEEDPGVADANTERFHAQLSDRREEPLERYRSEGDIEGGIEASDIVIDLQFRTPVQAHAALEPPVCLVDPTRLPWRVLAPTQAPTRARAALARAIGMSEDQIEVEPAPMGGAFGRKSQSDFIVEAGRLAQKLGRPVKVMWTRDDDLRNDYYRPPSDQRIRIGLSQAGQPLAWHHQTVFPSVITAFAPDADPAAPAAWEAAQGASSLPYQIPAVLVEGGSVRVPVRVGWVRAVHYVHHATATNIALDAAARSLGEDPIAFHRRLLPASAKIALDLGDPRWSVSYDTERLHGVCQQVQRMSDWQRPRPAGTGRGFALSLAHGTAAACVVELTVSANRAVRLAHVWLAMDCGKAVNPDGVRQQIEGGVIEALAATLWQEIRIEAGAVEAATFAEYPMFNMQHLCPIHTAIMPSSQTPAGVGETALPPVAPAVANAVFDAIGERHTVLPLLVDGVLREVT